MKKHLLTFVLLAFTLMANAETETKTVNIEGTILTQAEYDSEWQQWDVRFKDENSFWKINLSVLCDDGQFAGTYTIDDDADGCYAEDLQEDENHAFTEMEVTFSLAEGVTDPMDGCEITGWGKDAEGTIYNFHMKKDAPIKPKEEKDIEVVVNDVQWPTETGGAYYEVAEKENPDNHWYLTLTKTDGMATSKQFDGIDVDNTYCQNSATGDVKLLNNGTINQAFDAENLEIKVDASLVMDDSIQYNISFTTPVTKDGEETLVFTDLQVDESYAEYGTTSLNASNDSILMYFQLTDYSDIPDEYTSENCIPELFVMHKGDTEYTEVYSNALLYARTEMEEGQTVPTFKAKFLGTDRIVYTIEASYVQPEITEYIDMDFDDCYMGNNTQYDDGFYFTHENDTSIVWIKVMSENVEGHYTIDDLNNNSSITLLNENGIGKPYYIWDADLDVTREGKVFTMSGTCKAGPYLVNLTLSYTIEGLEYDNYEEDTKPNLTYTKDDLVSMTEGEDSWGAKYVYVELVSKKWNDILTLLFYTEDFDGTKIPEGEYDISEAGYSGSVLAGQPVEEGLTPSYYGKLDEQGNINNPLWFLRSGSVNVDEDGSFVVDAKNSYYRAIHVAYTNTTDIKDINTDADINADGKFLKNGELVIRKAGVEYNALGQRK